MSDVPPAATDEEVELLWAFAESAEGKDEDPWLLIRKVLMRLVLTEQVQHDYRNEMETTGLSGSC